MTFFSAYQGRETEQKKIKKKIKYKAGSPFVCWGIGYKKKKRADFFWRRGLLQKKGERQRRGGAKKRHFSLKGESNEKPKNTATTNF